MFCDLAIDKIHTDDVNVEFFLSHFELFLEIKRSGPVQPSFH